MAKGRNTTRVVKRRKKNNQESIKINNVSGLDGNVKGIVFIVIAVVAFFALFYLLTLFLLHRNAEVEKEKNQADISYSEILAGRSFSMYDEEYYVLFYDSKSNDAYIYSNIMSSYEGKEEHLPIYYVDLGNGFNKAYLTDDEVNTNPQDISELKVHGATLIKFSSGNVVEYLEGEDSIKETLN